VTDAVVERLKALLAEHPGSEPVLLEVGTSPSAFRPRSTSTRAAAWSVPSAMLLGPATVVR